LCRLFHNDPRYAALWGRHPGAVPPPHEWSCSPVDAERHVVEGTRVKRCVGCGLYHFLHTSRDGTKTVVHIAEDRDLPPGFTPG
jgi:hypothetical protein